MRALVMGLVLGLGWNARALVLEGTLDGDEGDFTYLPFEVPAGTREVELAHDDLSEKNILDWGMDDPAGFRGWGGGLTANAVVGEKASSRSYLPGPIQPGAWRVVIGLARISERPIKYRVELTFRDTPTLPDDATLAPYADATLKTGARWWAGDLHVHSTESGDAYASMEEVATFARSRGLDFIELSEHNTTSQLLRTRDLQARHPDLLIIPGVEYTTYAGHANGIGATSWVNHRLGPDVTIEAAAKAFAAQGAVLSINHPVLDLGNGCIGCAWKQAIPAEVGAIEIATGTWSRSGRLFDELAIAKWDELLDEGRALAALGGSDDHRGGQGTGPFDSPIGGPTTRVFAPELSTAALVQAIREGRTVVQLEGPDDPMVELFVGDAMIGSRTSSTTPLEAVARVTGGTGREVRFVIDGQPELPVAITSDPFDAHFSVSPAQGRTTRVRAEVLVDGKPRTVTSHVWVGYGEPAGGSGCRCTQAPLGLLLFWPLIARRRRPLRS